MNDQKHLAFYPVTNKNLIKYRFKQEHKMRRYSTQKPTQNKNFDSGKAVRGKRSLKNTQTNNLTFLFISGIRFE